MWTTEAWPYAPVNCTAESTGRLSVGNCHSELCYHLAGQQVPWGFIAEILTSSLEKEPWESQAQDYSFSIDPSQDWFLHCSKLETPAMYVQLAIASIYCSGIGSGQNMLGKPMWILRLVRIASKANVICLIRFLSSLGFVFFKIWD